MNKKIPSIKVPVIEKGITSKVLLSDELKGKKVIIFGVPGAFTPTCSEKHMPSYIKLHKQFSEKGIDDIYCLSVNDEFVMNAWLLSYTDEDKIKEKGGIDLCILGIGTNGHIAFNEPSSSLGSRTRVKTLTQETIKDNSIFFNDIANVPKFAITMGVGTIMEAKEILLLASGKSKAIPIKKAIEGPITSMCSASAIQMHPKTIVILDEDAAKDLNEQDYYKWVHRNKVKFN